MVCHATARVRRRVSLALAACVLGACSSGDHAGEPAAGTFAAPSSGTGAAPFASGAGGQAQVAGGVGAAASGGGGMGAGGTFAPIAGTPSLDGTGGAGGTAPLDASVAPMADATTAVVDADTAGDASDAGDLLVAPPVATGCLTAAHLTPGVHQVDCDTTVHVLTVPEQCIEHACGVIVDVHGGMMSSQMQDKNTSLSALGQQHGYFVIQPNALPNALLLGQRLFVADAPGAPADDTRVMNILTDVIEAFHADTARIHMTGFSEGGYMTWRWFCEHSDLLASVAPGAASWQCAILANLGLTPPEVGCELAGSSVPARNIPVLYMQGTQDGLVDPVCADAWFRDNVISALELDAGQQVAGDASFRRTLYLDPDGVPLEYIEHDYTSTSAFLGVPIAGHCYPGSTDLTVTPPAETVIPPDQIISFGCNDQTAFTWGEEVIQFFIAHPKQ